MEAEVWNEFVDRSQDVGDDERQETYDAQEWALESFEAARCYYNDMMWLECYDELVRARDYTKNMLYSQHDTTSPVIQDWGVDELPIDQSGFGVWAIVTDDFSGVQNVSIVLEMNDEVYEHYDCTRDGTNWSASIPAFEIVEDTNLDVYAIASDWGMNGALLLLFSQELAIAAPLPEIPWALITGIGAGAVAITAALFLFRRKSV
jgi:hypothetical protein